MNKITLHKGFRIEKSHHCYRVRGIRDSYCPQVGGADWERFPSLRKAIEFINRNGK